MTALDDTTREAVRAYYRLHKATAAAIADPFTPGVNEALSNAAHEAHEAMKAAGLLNHPPHEILALVRQEYPDFGSGA
ncbi:hypothetical protein CFC35_41680 [Streptomyces sp. FBKL.4005]|uniref:hypothetical protein n=1 Tax=Streptomyces sp. FBKL.4005 TaxID=2015515 RepID=UPI000B9710E5|nr:hypothetical protein [Streptomyces sp. FBKL.4005]OYP10153.1 hypothetical protein CFC35_41680 [Streptomyces sp. FBKL.4005]